MTFIHVTIPKRWCISIGTGLSLDCPGRHMPFSTMFSVNVFAQLTCSQSYFSQFTRVGSSETALCLCCCNTVDKPYGVAQTKVKVMSSSHGA